MAKLQSSQRRRFLHTLGAGGVLAGTAAAIGHVNLTQADAPPAKDDDNEAARSYRETDHIRAFYATLRD